MDKGVDIFKLCDECSNEFKLGTSRAFGTDGGIVSTTDGGIVSTMDECPHCQHINHTWIRVVIIEDR